MKEFFLNQSTAFDLHLPGLKITQDTVELFISSLASDAMERTLTQASCLIAAQCEVLELSLPLTGKFYPGFYEIRLWSTGNTDCHIFDLIGNYYGKQTFPEGNTRIQAA